MCAIRLNWMADLPFDQARAGRTKGTPVFRRGFTSEMGGSVGDISGYQGRVSDLGRVFLRGRICTNIERDPEREVTPLAFGEM